MVRQDDDLVVGIEALPFDLATLWMGQQVRERFSEACREVKIVVSFVGKRITSLADAVSGGTVASLRSLLEYDTTDCVKNPACLLPADALTAVETAQRNAYRFVPHYDDDPQSQGARLPSGIYFYNIRTPQATITRRFVLLE